MASNDSTDSEDNLKPTIPESGREESRNEVITDKMATFVDLLLNKDIVLEDSTLVDFYSSQLTKGCNRKCNCKNWFCYDTYKCKSEIVE